jgi:hypothetical protein
MRQLAKETSFSAILFEELKPKLKMSKKQNSPKSCAQKVTRADLFPAAE